MTAKRFLGKCARAPWPSRCSRPEKAGTKAALKAPSPNRRRNRLGSLSATKKASAIGPAPSQRGDQHVPSEAQDAAGHGPAADGEDAFQHGAGV